MPRVRPLKTKEEIDAVPLDKPVTIALEPEGVVDLPKAPDKIEKEAQPVDKVAKKPESESPKEPKEPKEDEEKVSLKKQLEDMRRASEAQIAEANRRAEEYQRQAQQREQGLSQRAQDAEYDAILNAIGAAESEAEAAQRDIALASEAGDHKAVAEANRKLARAESRLAQLEDGKSQIEYQKAVQAQRAKEPPRAAPPPKEQTPEEFIDQMPNLLPSQRDWLRQHTELITNVNKNLRLQGAHAEAIDDGLRPGSQKYFDHLEMRLGYKKPAEEEEEDPEEVERTMTSAPPSRQATSPDSGAPQLSMHSTI